MPQENWKEEFDHAFGWDMREIPKHHDTWNNLELRLKSFIQSLLDKQREEITDKLHTLHANFKVEWLNNDYLEPDFDASAKKEILNAKMGLIELILTEIKKGQ